MSNAVPQPADDADVYLVRQIRDGDQRAWSQLIARYQGRLFAFAKSRLGSQAEAEDALQETLLGFVSSLRHFDEDRSLETYLFAILRYKIQEILTKRKRTPDAPLGMADEDDGPLDAAAATWETPSRIAARAENTRRASRALADVMRALIGELRDRGKLDDLQVVELLFFAGLRNKDAGEKLGRDEKAVAGVKFRALNRLRELMSEAIEAGRIDPAAAPVDQLAEDDAGIAQVWRRHRVSCLKRSTLGSYLLGALDDQWEAYARFHLETVGCEMCKANLEDLSGPEGEPLRDGLQEQLFQSSVGFLSRAGESQA